MTQPSAYHHTHVSVYLVGVFAVAALFYNSCQGILQKYELNRKWFYLYGATCLFAYLYLRPLIRRQLGSASHGYINFYSVYIFWLCAAIFLHLPSFQSLGIDFKTDVSVLLTIFLLSLLVLGVIHIVHWIAVFFKLMAPSLYNPSYNGKEMWSIVLLNSMSLALACSTYYSFCGNAGTQRTAASEGEFREAVCSKWLHPVRLSQHPIFKGWVIYGEGAGSVSDESLMKHLNVDIPLDGLGLIGFPAADAISPVFTLWVTLVLMYLVNSLADYGAASVLRAAFTADLRKGALSKAYYKNRRSKRRHSADISRSVPTSPLMHRTSLEMMLRSQSSAAAATQAVGSLLRGVSGVLLNGQMPVAQPSARRPPLQPKSHWDQSLPPPIRTSSDPLGPSRGQEEEEVSEDKPDFMPMFPWYSGTSADMYRTMFDLLISVKLFLGRYDMRTMQAATSAVPPGAGSEPPKEGDGFTFEHLAERDSLWLDFCADVGDGGDPTYAVACCMAAPSLTATMPPAEAVRTSSGVSSSTGEANKKANIGGDELGSPGSSSSSGLDSPSCTTPRQDYAGPYQEGKTNKSGAQTKTVQLPRGDVLIIGGDLAYPNPSNETYETRFFRPYEAALPPPPHVHSGRLVVNKPDLPLRPAAASCCSSASSTCAQHSDAAVGRHSMQPTCRACAAAEALKQYDGPTCFAIPGNHDWIDGLETYQRHIQQKGWLGGWLLPQENSYFALKLPHGWWLFGLDLALVDDIDMCQCRYFARIADERMGPDDQVILVTHQPRWLMDWFWEEAGSHNLRQLVRGHLRGRARIHLAGDLHFYMRHSFRPAPPPTAPVAVDADGRQNPTSDSFAKAAPRLSEDIPGSLGNGLDTPFKTLSERHGSLLSEALTQKLQGPVPIVADSVMSAGSVAGMSRTTSYASSLDDFGDIASRSQSAGFPPVQTPGSANLHPFDPEHLVVNGLGGAFLHPTHVFASARFASVPEPGRDDVFIRGASPRGLSPPRGRSPKAASPQGGSPRGHSPQAGSRGVSPVSRKSRNSRRGSFTGEAAVGKLEGSSASMPGGGGEFSCAAAYPAPKRSIQLGRQNLHLFRLKNTRFDFIGGGLYFLMVVSVLPRCHNIAAILDAPCLSSAVGHFLWAAVDTLVAIFAESYLSLATLVVFFMLVFGFARSGGIGAVPGAPTAAAARLPFYESLALRGRTGGLATQLVFAALHTATHAAAAIFSVVLLELGVETCIRYESLGSEGYHSLYRWYQAFEAAHFPDPMGLRETVATWSLGIYPNCLKFAMALFDVPESIAVSRSTLCTKGMASLTRLQAAGYYAGMLAYYWVLATPAVGFLFGCYLYLAVNWFHVHYDEAFSALRIPHYKGFSRLHFMPNGDLVVYALAMDQVPNEWQEDRRWREADGGGIRTGPAHRSKVPSRWVPVSSSLHAADPDRGDSESSEIKVVDHFVVPKKRPT